MESSYLEQDVVNVPEEKHDPPAHPLPNLSSCGSSETSEVPATPSFSPTAHCGLHESECEPNFTVRPILYYCPLQYFALQHFQFPPAPVSVSYHMYASHTFCYLQNPSSRDEEVGPIYVTAAESFGGMSLADMPRHKLKLERAKEEALARNEPRRSSKTTPDANIPDLGAVLRIHKSALERAKEEALARNEPTSVRAELVADQVESLDAVLVPHKSALERAKEEAVKRNEPRRTPRSTLVMNGPPMESMLMKSYSRVEREKMEAQLSARSADTVSEDFGQAQDISVRRSRLQLEREAAARLAEQTRAREEARKLAEQAALPATPIEEGLEPAPTASRCADDDVLVMTHAVGAGDTASMPNEDLAKHPPEMEVVPTVH
jgi:hypothetical protein